MGDGLTHAVLLFDSGADVGLGHRRRMEGLALALEERGVTVGVAPAGDHNAGGDLVVVDSYRHGPDLGAGATVIAVVDDLGNDVAVDVVVDPAPGARDDDHPSAAVVLAGASFALLGPGLPAPTAAAAAVETVLVSAGGTDAAGVGATIAAELVTRLPAVSIRLVVGPWGSDHTPPGVEVVRSPAGLGPELAAASLIVTAAGVTMLEAMHAARPTVAFVTAENQRRQATGAAALGGVALTTATEAAATAAGLVDDDDERLALAARAAGIVDGQGADRVAARLVALLAERA